MVGFARRLVPAFGVTAIGFVLLVGALVHVLFFHVPAMATESDPALLVLALVELSFLVLPPIGLVYVGFRIADTDLPTEPSGGWTIVGWCTLGAVTIPVVIGAIKAHQYFGDVPIDPTIAQLEILTGAGGGGVLGVLIGVQNARAWRNANRVREQRDAFVFLNNVLRHHVLNSLNVVIGYSREGRDRLPSGERDVLDPVVHRSESIVALIENVGLIAETFAGEFNGEAFDLVSLLGDEIEACRLMYGYAEFEASLPDRPVPVSGNRALRVAFENVLTNAVQHSDRQMPFVRISLSAEGSTATIRVADDGPGISTNVRARLLEPRETGADGFGLYLANTIVEFHGGTMSIEDNDPRGTVVETTLPIASPDA